MSQTRKRGNDKVFSPDNVANKAVKQSSIVTDKMAASQQVNNSRLFGETSSQNQTQPKISSRDSVHSDSDDDYDGQHMDHSQTIRPKMAKVPDGIDLTEISSQYPSMPEWIPAFSAYLTNNIAKDICQDINDSMEHNFNLVMEVHKSVKTAVDKSLDKFRAEMKGMSSRITQLESWQNELKSENTNLKQKLQNQEQYSRRSNLVISGIPQVNREENLHAWFENFAYHVLHIEKEISIERIHRVGRPPVRYNPNYSRPIIIRFSFYQDREAVWEARGRLKDGIGMSEDFPPEVLEARKRLLPIAKEAKDIHNMKATVIGDKLIVNSIPYTTANLEDLPPALHPISRSQRETRSQISFFRKWSPLSNHHPANFTLYDREYNCNEQFFLSEKCRAYGYDNIAEDICKSTDPSEMVQQAKVCKSYNQRWKNIEADVMSTGLNAKFDQNDHLKKYLLSTGTKTLVEGSPYDHVWGVKLAFNDPRIDHHGNWRGENKLGNCLMQVREQLSCQE